MATGIKDVPRNVSYNIYMNEQCFVPKNKRLFPFEQLSVAIPSEKDIPYILSPFESRNILKDTDFTLLSEKKFEKIFFTLKSPKKNGFTKKDLFQKIKEMFQEFIKTKKFEWVKENISLKNIFLYSFDTNIRGDKFFINFEVRSNERIEELENIKNQKKKSNQNLSTRVNNNEERKQINLEPNSKDEDAEDKSPKMHVEVGSGGMFPASFIAQSLVSGDINFKQVKKIQESYLQANMLQRITQDRMVWVNGATEKYREKIENFPDEKEKHLKEYEEDIERINDMFGNLHDKFCKEKEEKSPKKGYF